MYIIITYIDNTVSGVYRLMTPNHYNYYIIIIITIHKVYIYMYIHIHVHVHVIYMYMYIIITYIDNTVSGVYRLMTPNHYIIFHLMIMLILIITIPIPLGHTIYILIIEIKA